MKTRTDLQFMQDLLPNHYICEQRKNGIHCHSPIGIDENDPKQWDTTFKAIKQHFGGRFLEVFSQTCTNHVKFTVFLR
ncbi:hypothetical protein ES705_28146 [subsurface metagenome]